VVRITDLVPEVAAVRGKGESLWRSLSAATGDVIVWIDADIRNFEPHFVTRLVAPLVMDARTSFVKAFYRRPIAHGDEVLSSGGGRVTELLARPLLNMLFPELSAVLQPLSGEYAGRREALERLPFFTGYSVEVGLLIDLLDAVGLEGMAQVDLDERVHRNRPLDELAPMAFTIGRTILRRAEDWGRIDSEHDYASLPLMLSDEQGGIAPHAVDELERPPMALFRNRTARIASRIDRDAAAL
jgi:glucosyl-3-phosphoglycerate synthase